MFTGIIEELGTVKRIQRGGKSIILTIGAKKVVEDIEIGDSISTNGVCLTVTEFNQEELKADVMPETMEKSNLGELKVGAEVNLERALRAGDRLGGHFVSGHIDEVGEIVGKKRDDNAVLFTIQPSPQLLKYIVPKGSIAVDGISLTVVELESNRFSVSIIPHTAEVTTLKNKSVGDTVNLEADMIGKYVNRMLKYKEEEPDEDIDQNLLQEKGFLLA